MLMFGFREIPQHVRGRAEKDEPPALIKQDGLVKHLKQFRTRLMNCDDDDLVVRHPANDLDDVFRVFRGETGSRFVKKVNIGRTDHIETDVEPFPLAAAEGFFDRAADNAVAAFVQTELDQFAFQPPRPIAPGKMRRANRGRKLKVLADR